VKNWIKTTIHIVVAMFAYLFAYQLVVWPPVQWWTSPEGLAVFGFACLYAGFAATFELLFRTERASWRYVSVPDALVLGRSVFLTAVTFLLVTFILVRADGVPRSVLLIAALAHLAGLAALRMVWRLSHEESLLQVFVPILKRSPASSNRLLLVGSLGVADSFLRELARGPSPQYDPVGIVGLHRSDIGQNIRGVSVRGTLSDLEATVSAFESKDLKIVSILFLSPPDVVQEVAPEVLGRLKARGIVLLRLPAMSELGATRDSLPNALRELSVEELLARPAIKLDLAQIHDLVNGRRVLVTGAGGSIGSELCRQIAAFGCAHLSMLDHSEFGLFKIDQEIGTTHPSLPRNEIICDVRDAARVHAAVQAETPDIVFHAAALKHVPMVEKHPAEGLLTNVVGTWNVAEAARAARVRQMVMISTDKAVDPCNVMGATKRLAEGIVRGQHGKSQTRFSVVRFGNVLGSAGSVVPTFQAQIQRGGPVTVTHPDIERYFMTIPEAVQLVL
jgi:O-antigen biosynthesis protein WbqV